jgi:putative RecB family exonuclease
MSVALEQVSREEAVEQLHVSYSQLRTYLTCPQKYMYQYVKGVEWERKSAALIFGKAVHKAVEQFYTTLQSIGKPLSVEEMVSIFDMVLEMEYFNAETEIVFKHGEDLARLKEQGAELVRVFHAEVKPQKIVGVEVPFSVRIPDVINGHGFLPVRLAGILDLVEADSDGTYLVVELKTSGQRFSSAKLEHDLQSTVYSYAMAQMRLGTTERSTLVRYDVLLKQKTAAMERYFVSRTTKDHQRLVQLLNHVLRAIELRVFYRFNGWQCGDCPFTTRCMGDM